MTNEFPAGASKNTYAECIFIEKDEATDYQISKSFEKMLTNKEFYEILKELIEFGISRYERDFSDEAPFLFSFNFVKHIFFFVRCF